jgi:CheY-like chemotaxis protein
MTKAKNKKMLLIEDDPTQRMMYELEFSNFGYKLNMASGGKEGIKKAKELKPGLIFLDLVMNDMDGLDVLVVIKKQKENKDTKIVVMTNLTKKGLEEKCRSLGAYDYIIKSKFIPKEIVKKAEKYLKNK